MSEMTIFDSDNYIDPDAAREEYADLLEDVFGNPAHEISDDSIYIWLSDMEQSDWEDAISEIDGSLQGRRLLAHGSIGRWDGISYEIWTNPDLSERPKFAQTAWGVDYEKDRVSLADRANESKEVTNGMAQEHDETHQRDTKIPTHDETIV